MKKAEIVEVIPSKKIVVGEKDAPVTLMMFGDYESQACAKAHKAVKELLEVFPQEVKFIFRHFPLLKIHQKAHKAAEASLAAAQEGKFWEMHNELFANRNRLGTISLKEHARAVGVKSKKILDELINSYYGVYVQDDLREGIALGIRDVPAIFINGAPFTGEPTTKNLTIMIQSLLGRTSVTKSTKRAA
ncbi:DsbA family protein [Chitinophagaceae bacterium LB-8]|uniref:DsbA family protein n=1 Tax=Paraflavisolibacter caeni TaxID=2982496 RepID=A0A9X3B7T8_9BACT|nr:DsbA family protein [Paraflavisolibacter caeni]MCU7548841.1 DsbA family protein [Paraflavisolibacter caeni]